MLNIDFVWAWFCSKHQQLRLPPSEPESAFWDNPSSCTPASAPFFFGSDRNKWRCPREKSLLISIFWQATGCFKSSVKLLISEYYCSRTVSAIRSHQVVSYFCAEDSPLLTFHFSTRADYYDSLKSWPSWPIQGSEKNSAFEFGQWEESWGFYESQPVAKTVRWTSPKGVCLVWTWKLFAFWSSPIG